MADQGTFCPSLVWLYPDDLSRRLDSATILESVEGLRQIGWQVDLLVACENEGPEFIQGVPAYSFRCPEVFFIKQLVFHVKATQYILRRWRSLAVVIFFPVSFPWLVLLNILCVGGGKNRPLFVLDNRTLPMEKEEITFRDRLRKQYFFIVNVLANWLVDGRTAITRRLADYLHIRPSKLWGIWPSGVRLDKFSAAIPGRQWPRDNDPVHLVYAGIFYPERDLIPMCQAVQQANQEGMCFTFSLVGSGKEEEKLAEFASQSGGCVRMLGSVPHSSVPAIFNKMHIGVLPFPDEIEFQVSSPIKLFEYMGAGMPILATRIAAHSDVLDNQPCVFWAETSAVKDLLAALRETWANRHGLRERGVLAARLAQDYSWAASAKKLSSALEFGLEINGRKPV